MPENWPEPVTNCPDPKVLEDYNLGRLDPNVLESIANHLAQCTSCEEKLSSLNDEQDTLIRGLRQHVVPRRSFSENGVTQDSFNLRTLPTTSIRTTPPPEVEYPRPFGRYELLGAIGHGGMGMVFQARQLGTNRLVALKVAQGSPDASISRRFRTEAEAIARLRHPNIVRIYDCDEWDGHGYFSMELVEGGSLSGRIAGNPLADREAALLISKLARAVQFAHDHAVLHRDLKPSNVLLEVDGEVKLSDFGLAKLLDLDTGHTRTESVIGTASYMSPEQASGDTHEIGPRADVYGLGAILYECLTGRPPFATKSRSQTLHLVRFAPPTAPSKLNPSVSRPLEAICLKCLEKAPSARYPTAAALADDLDRWLQGDSPSVWKERWRTRPIRFVRRHLSRLLLAAAFLFLLALAAVPWTLRTPNREPAPDAAALEIERELAQGRPVTLIGPTGGPRWSRIALHEGQSQQSSAPSQEFTFTSWSLGLLELVRDPQSTSYRLTTEVKHEDSESLGGVGLYFAYRDHAIDEGHVHQFIHLSFNDIKDYGMPPVPVIGKAIRPDLLPKKPLLNAVGLYPRFYLPSPERPLLGKWDPRLDVLPSRRLCKPSGLRKTDWRRLEVRVSRDAIQAFWEGDQPIGSMKMTDITIALEKMITGLRERAAPGPLGFFVRSDFDFRGGLGLYVSRGVAAFRSTVIEPLTLE